MADDEFAQVYGDTEGDIREKTEFNTKRKVEINEQDDEALFMQLYGGAMPAEDDDAVEEVVSQKDIVLKRAYIDISLI